MSVLNGLEPNRVFYYFEEICRIPHGSFNTDAISRYLVDFAAAHGLECRRDESDNVVIKKPAAPGYEQAPAVILQGHSDMVCEKVPGSDHDFEKDGLELVVDGDMIRARETTLGADNGIAVAYALALLEDGSLQHPALEVVITSNEEVGLLGAKALDTSDLKGRYFINMDSEEEGKLWISCAGGVSMTAEIAVECREEQGTVYEITVDGLLGGHSGAEIDKIRANSNKLIGQLLFELAEQVDYQLISISGGLKDNAIPRLTTARILADQEEAGRLADIAAAFQQKMREEYSGSDAGITVAIAPREVTAAPVFSPVSRQKVLFFLMHMPYGVQKMSGEIPGLVETSVNPGVLTVNQEGCRVILNIRSSVSSAKTDLARKIRYLTEFLGGACNEEGDYPAWEYRRESRLRDIMAETYQELFAERPDIVAIHAGLECGVFYEKIADLDCVSFGPEMKDIHTTEETLFIASTERMWKLLIKTLENIRE